MTQAEVDRLYRQAERCKERKDHNGYWKFRRAFLLAQAQLYEERQNASPLQGGKRP